MIARVGPCQGVEQPLAQRFSLKQVTASQIVSYVGYSRSYSTSAVVREYATA